VSLHVSQRSLGTFSENIESHRMSYTGIYESGQDSPAVFRSAGYCEGVDHPVFDQAHRHFAISKRRNEFLNFSQLQAGAGKEGAIANQ
jgi:hypothetical protein